MDQKKLVILVLVVIAILAVMAIAAGVFRDRSEGTGTPSRYEPDAGVRLLDGLMAPFRSRFEVDRMVGCERSDVRITVSGSCEIVIRPRKSRPGAFKLSPTSGAVEACFGLAREAYNACRGGSGDEGPQRVRTNTRFTVTADSAFLFLQCVGSSPCRLSVALR